MRRQIGLKRSFNYEDLASIVESATTHQCRDNGNSHHPTEKQRRHKRTRTCSSMPLSSELPTVTAAKQVDASAHRSSHARLISPTASRDRVTITITPESSPSMQSMTMTDSNNTNASAFFLSDCPATAALNRSMSRQLSNEWNDSPFFALQEGKEQCSRDGQDAWPVMASSPTSLDMFPVRRVTLTSRTCSLRQRQEDKDNEAESEVGKLQTAFSLLSLPNRK